MEILDVIESRRRRKRERIEELFVAAEAVANRVGYVFADPKKRSESDLLWPWHIFPDLFSEEAEEKAKRAEEAETAAIKAMMDARVRAMNKKCGGNDGA